MSRAAFLCAFKEEVMSGHAHAFYVKYSKFKSLDQRKRAKKAAAITFNKFRESLLEERKKYAGRLMMLESIRRCETFGNLKDK